MIDVSQLEFRYPQSEFALSIPKLSISNGEKIAIVGPSGSGKTTLLNLIAGMIVPHSGSIHVDGETVSEMTDAKRRDFRISKIGMVFQQFELIEYLNVHGNILLPFDINASLKLTDPIRKRVIQLATAMGIDNKLKQPSGTLSQGEQQRVAICRALITSPKLILADEPTGNLDPKNKRLILNLLFEQANQTNQTLLVVTHDMGILDGFDQVIDFEQFRIDDVEAGNTEPAITGEGQP
jgi:putative ABC transport system ATP-binding protein